MITNTINTATNKPPDALIILVGDMLVTLAVTNRTTPTGGVTKPNAKLIVIINPKWTGSTPIAVTTGKRTGTRIKIAAVISKNIPIISSNTLIINKIIIGFSLMDNNAVDTCCGICSIVKDQPKMLEAAIINVIEAVSFPVLTNTLGKSDNFNDLYTKTPMKIATKTAIAPDSVGMKNLESNQTKIIQVFNN